MATEPGDSNLDPANITTDRAALRYFQIHHIAEELAKIDKRITDAKTKLTTLKEEREAAVASMMKAARDEGECPLFGGLD